MKLSLIRFIKFSLVGSAGLGIGLATIFICVEYFLIPKSYAWFISTAVTVLFNFCLNNLFTWPDRRASSFLKTTHRLGLYYFFNSLSISINYLVYRIILSFDIYYILAVLGGVAVSTGLNFFWSDFFVWKSKHHRDQYARHN